MDLIFNKIPYTPSKDFWGALSKDRFNELFGHFSRFIARLLFKEETTPFEIVYKFVIDSGAFISYAPDLILNSLKIKPEFMGWFAFHSFDKGPSLLGMKGILEKAGILKKFNEDQLILQMS